MKKASARSESPSEVVEVIGLGLAGCLIAWKCIQAGKKVRAWHQSLPGAASEVAPGLINPLASRKFAMSEWFPLQWETAQHLYAEMEAELGLQLFHKRTILRVIRNDVQERAFKRMLEDKDSDPRAKTIGEVFAPGHWDFLQRDTRGSFETIGGGWVDLPKLVECVREWLCRKGCVEDRQWQPEATPEARCVIHCQGWRAGADPLWSYLPHNPAKGELLWVRPARPLPENYLLHGGTWLQAVEPGLWRVGARYSWDGFEDGPSQTGAEALTRQIRDWLDCDWECLRSEAGVRPIIEDTKPVVGTHPEATGHYIFNGLGSKGAIQGPWLAGQLMQILREGTSSLPLTHDVRRFNARWVPPRKAPFWKRWFPAKSEKSGD